MNVYLILSRYKSPQKESHFYFLSKLFFLWPKSHCAPQNVFVHQSFVLLQKIHKCIHFQIITKGLNGSVDMVRVA